MAGHIGIDQSCPPWENRGTGIRRDFFKSLLDPEVFWLFVSGIGTPIIVMLLHFVVDACRWGLYGAGHRGYAGVCNREMGDIDFDWVQAILPLASFLLFLTEGYEVFNLG